MWFFPPPPNHPNSLEHGDPHVLIMPTNSCTPCLAGHIGHAHMLPKFEVISCMPPHAPCTSRAIRVCRRASLNEDFLVGPTKWSQTLCTPYHDHGMHVGGEFIHHGLIFVEIPLIAMCITCKWACVKFIRWLEGQNINLSYMQKMCIECKWACV